MWCTRTSSIIISPFLNTFVILPLINLLNNTALITVVGNSIFLLANILIAINISIVNFIPSFISYKKDRKEKMLIMILNIFLGWTFLGWVVCFVWSLSNTNTEVNNNSNKYEDLERLQKLKENGTISKEEFETEKQKILR